MAAFSMPTRMDMCAASYGLLVMYKYAAALPAAVVAIRAQIFRCHPGSAAWDRRVNGEVDEDFTTTTSCCMVKRPLCHHLTVLPQLEACIKHCVPRLAKRSPPPPPMPAS
ncbi:hypothetical protein PC111_g13134 [Phytophthora cactorum]|nr:hypothetical protein PC111_g13134 [Phytophthora cactorum]KAG3143388.1 hypothetical protein C6341_g19090 [Phytophthora cactorum]